jgi:hypothetical protein
MRTNAIGRVLFLCMAASTAGCAAGGPAFQKVAVPDGKSVIYAYRPNSLFGGGIVPTVTCGAQGVALSRGGYHPFVVDPGDVNCTASTESTSTVRVDARANEASYVKERIGMGLFVGRPHLTEMSPEEGEREARECRLQEE